MKIVNVGGTRYLVGEVVNDELQVRLNDAMEITVGGAGTDNLKRYLQFKNLGELETIELQGSQAFSIKGLTAAEEIELQNQLQKMDLAKKIAVPDLENRIFSKM